MSLYCRNCGDKLEVISLIDKITEFNVRGFLSEGSIRWSNKFLAYCDNVNCDLSYLLVVKGLTSEARSNRFKSATSLTKKEKPIS